MRDDVSGREDVIMVFPAMPQEIKEILEHVRDKVKANTPVFIF